MEEIKQAAIQEESKEKEVKKSVKEEFAVELED
jgi:hypothetical protein